MALTHSISFRMFAYIFIKTFSLKDIYIRTITGAIFLIVVIGSLLFHPLAFFTLFFIFNFIGLNEFILLARKGESRKGSAIYFTFGSLIYVITAGIGLGYIDIRFAYLAFALLSLLIIFEVIRKDKPSWQRVGAYLAAYFYVSIPFGLMNALFLTKGKLDFSPAILISLFVIIWSSDIFAYLVGSMIGKHRLHERISPKKSWEGSIGGLVFACIAAYILSLFISDYSLVEWLILASIIVITGTFGDLSESLLKREAGVKDSGNIFPGHGGVLDRFDAVLLATPFVFVYVNLI